MGGSVVDALAGKGWPPVRSNDVFVPGILWTFIRMFLFQVCFQAPLFVPFFCFVYVVVVVVGWFFLYPLERGENAQLWVVQSSTNFDM